MNLVSKVHSDCHGNSAVDDKICILPKPYFNSSSIYNDENVFIVIDTLIHIFNAIFLKR